MRFASKSTVLISAATAFSLLGDQVLYSVLPVYYDELGLSALKVGILLSANRWIRLVTNHLADWAVRRIRGDVLILAAFVLGAATTAMYTATWSFTILLTARIAWGLSWSFIRHVGVLQIMADVPVDASGRVMGYYNGISRVGSVAGLFGGALLVDLMGYDAALWLLAAVSLAALPLAKAGTARVIVTLDRARPTDGPAQARAFLVLGFVIGAVGSGLVMATLGAVLDTRLGNIGVLSAATLTGALLAVRFMLDSVAAPWLGSLTDTHGVRTTVAGFMTAGGIALILAAISADVIVVGGLVIVFFVAGTALQAGVAGVVSQFGSRSFAHYVTAVDFGAAAGPLLGWMALDYWAFESAGLLIGGCVYLAGAAFGGLAIKR